MSIKIDEEKMRLLTNKELKVLGGVQIIVTFVLTIFDIFWFWLMLGPLGHIVFSSIIITLFTATVATVVISGLFTQIEKLFKIYKSVSRILDERNGWEDDKE
jgi:hypothetical protein